MPDKVPESYIKIKPVTKISELLVAISAIAIGIMMFVSIADICGRFFFLAPIEGTFEIVGLLLVITSSLGLGWCQLLKGNIRIDVLYNRLGRKGQVTLDIVSYLLSAAVCIIITWQASLMASDFMFKQLGTTTGTLGVLIWPFMLIMTMGFAWVTIIFIIDLVNSFIEMVKR